MMSETTMKDIIHIVTIKVITDEKIVRGLVSDTSSIIKRKMGEKLMVLQIWKEVCILLHIIPRVIKGSHGFHDVRIRMEDVWMRGRLTI